MENLYYHFFSDGNETKELAINENDFIATVNRLAMCAFRTGLSILAFNIEESHLHVFAKGSPEQAQSFKKLFAKATVRYLNDTRTIPPIFELAFYRLPDDPLQIKRVAAYVIVQPTKDGKHVMYYDYTWGSGSLYFRKGVRLDNLWVPEGSKPESASSLSERKMISLTRTASGPYPEDWMIYNSLILPSSFVDIKELESLMGSANAFRVFCGSGRDRDTDILDNISRASGRSLEDREMRHHAIQLSIERFDTEDLRMLSYGQRLQIARNLRRRYQIGYAQLSRILHVPEDQLQSYVK